LNESPIFVTLLTRKKAQRSVNIRLQGSTEFQTVMLSNSGRLRQIKSSLLSGQCVHCIQSVVGTLTDGLYLAE
jgi:hypothetical protein